MLTVRDIQNKINELEQYEKFFNNMCKTMNTHDDVRYFMFNNFKIDIPDIRKVANWFATHKYKLQNRLEESNVDLNMEFLLQNK